MRIMNTKNGGEIFMSCPFKTDSNCKLIIRRFGTSGIIAYGRCVGDYECPINRNIRAHGVCPECLKEDYRLPNEPPIKTVDNVLSKRGKKKSRQPLCRWM